MTNRQRVAANRPVVLGSLASDLNTSIKRLTALLGEALGDYWDGRAGATTSTTTKSLFGVWCRQSLIASPDQAVDLVIEHLKTRPGDSEGVASILRTQCEVPAAAADRAADRLVGTWTTAPVADDMKPIMWEAYGSQREKFCAQTAHVLVARALLYRVGEDKKLFPERISGQTWEREQTNARASAWTTGWVFFVLEQVRAFMRTLVPSVYESGEFDWWVVDASHRTGLNGTERGRLERHDAGLNSALEDAINALDGYNFTAVDVDVWHDVYQHYLPSEERQRLGGFYTPDELVSLVLELAGWVPGSVGLCRRRLIDPACGSGTFLVQASSVLLEHLEQRLACHRDVSRAKTPWERSQLTLERLAGSIHGIDLHPFAAFLSTLNVLFVVLERYVAVKSANHGFVLDLAVFAHDSLEKTKAEEISPSLWAAMNSRVALTEYSLKRFGEILDRRFDYVVGNPPWGGVLKGRLAPVFDAVMKQKYRTEYPNSAVGKYDIYGLFMERGFGWLGDDGVLALITQNTYFDKDWAAHLRDYLATSGSIETLVDLGPFGQLFFGRMNTPAVTTVRKRIPASDFVVEVVRSHPPRKWKSRKVEQRRGEVTRAVAKALISKSPRSANTGGVAYYTPVPQAQLKSTAPVRWQFDSAFPVKGPRHPVAISTLLSHRQGVTPGGALDLYLLDGPRAKAAKLETELVRPAIKSRGIRPWMLPDQDLVLLYPYTLATGEPQPAFRIKHPKLKDSLDFDVALDTWEATRRSGGGAWVQDTLEHRIAKGLVAYPNAARYLVGHYQRLQSRTFEGQNIREFRKAWYEYHRPRGSEVVSGVPRLVSPSLVRDVRFALDTQGFLSDHAAIFLVVTNDTAKTHADFRKKLASALGRTEDDTDVMLYLLAHLNTDYALEVLKRGRNPTPKGYYPINESFMDEIMVNGDPTAAVAKEAIDRAKSEIGALAAT